MENYFTEVYILALLIIGLTVFFLAKWKLKLDKHEGKQAIIGITIGAILGGVAAISLMSIVVKVFLSEW